MRNGPRGWMRRFMKIKQGIIYKIAWNHGIQSKYANNQKIDYELKRTEIVSGSFISKKKEEKKPKYLQIGSVC